MANETFVVSKTKEKDETKFTENGKKKFREYTFSGVDNEGVVIRLTIKGPIEAIEKRFVAFPTDAGTDIELNLDTNISTITQEISDAIEEEIDIDKEIEELDL